MNRVVARVQNRHVVGVQTASCVTTLQKRAINNNISRPLKRDENGKERKREKEYRANIRNGCASRDSVALRNLRATRRRIILIRIDNLSQRNDDSCRSHIVNLSNWIYSRDYINQNNATRAYIV